MREADVGLRWFAKAGELQILHQGERAISVTENSRPFVVELPPAKDLEVMVGYGRIRREPPNAAGISGTLPPVGEKQDGTAVMGPAMDIPSVLIYICKLSTDEKAICGVEFQRGIPYREMTLQVPNWGELNPESFRRFCEQKMGNDRG